MNFLVKTYGKLKRLAADIISISALNISGKKRQSLNQLNELKGKFNGNRCFIVCNGPSLKSEDLDKLYKHNEFSFASNRINKIFNSTEWRPTFYACFDEGLQYHLNDVFNTVPSKYKFFRNISFIKTHCVKDGAIWVNTVGNRRLLDNPLFSNDASNQIYAIATVTYCMLQLAYHLGFNEVYIIGCDNSYGLEKQKDGKIINTGKQSFFKEDVNPKTQAIIASIWEMNIAYETALKFSQTHPNFKIYNATRGGHLETFPRVDFDSLF